jgi:hypothetical protein
MRHSGELLRCCGDYDRARRFGRCEGQRRCLGRRGHRYSSGGYLGGDRRLQLERAAAARQPECPCGGTPISAGATGLSVAGIASRSLIGGNTPPASTTSRRSER